MKTKELKQGETKMKKHVTDYDDVIRKAAQDERDKCCVYVQLDCQAAANDRKPRTYEQDGYYFMELPFGIVQRRDPEYQQPVDPGEADEPNEEDAMAHKETSLDINGSVPKWLRPKDKWDLVLSKDESYSAPLFPKLRDKRKRTVLFRSLESQIKAWKISKRELYLRAQALKNPKLRSRSIRMYEYNRIWEIWKIEQFLRNKRK